MLPGVFYITKRNLQNSLVKILLVSICFYLFTFEKYNSLAFKIIIRSFRMKKQILTGVLLSVLAVSSAYAHKDKKDAKKPELSSQLVAHKDKKDAKKPKNSVV
ncbi:hypothetical protein KVD21_05825 [Helicobacter pylori]|nr:hypothetical protein KVD21_05825 [Helicobacter pylori]